MKIKLTDEQCSTITTGEIALASVLAICAIALVAVIVYKIFMSKEGGTTIPGGWKFSWEN